MGMEGNGQGCRGWWSDVCYKYWKRNSYLRKLDNSWLGKSWIAQQCWHLICLGDHTSQWNRSALWFSLVIFPVHPQLLRNVSMAVIIATKLFSNLQLWPVFFGLGVNTWPKLSEKNLSFIFGLKIEILPLLLQLLDFIIMCAFFEAYSTKARQWWENEIISLETL